ncbi:MAG: hypothetical protein E6I97_09535 [Chloroflexi bacterium]|nr:MAG: hypothetical protein E6I97_09535 [Chloroflexota bacterium]
MSGQTRRPEDAVGLVHLDDSTLLAYIDQPFSDSARSNVQPHLILCAKCQQRYGELKRTTNLLTDTIAHFKRLHHYPPLTLRMLEHIQDPAAAGRARRQRRQERLREDLALGAALLKHSFGGIKAAPAYLLPRFRRGQKRPKSTIMASIPVASIPAVVFLVLVAVFVVLAYSFSINSALKPFRPSSAVTNVVQPTPIIESRQATPTVTPETIFPANPGTTPVATPTHGSPKPTISLCSIGSDKDKSRIRFCGSNFTAGDQVQLVISLAGNQSKVRHPVLVDARGSFQDSWVIDNCKFMPISVFAEDITPGHTAEVSQVLQNFQFQNCVPPTQGPPSRDW